MRYIVKRKEKKDKLDWSNVTELDIITENTPAYHDEFIIYDLLTKKVINSRTFIDAVLEDFITRSNIFVTKREDEELANAIALVMNKMFYGKE